MSSHTRALDATSRLTGELTVDVVFLMHRRPWHWPAVAVGTVAGAVIGLVASHLVGHLTVFLTLSSALVLAGLGMNVGSDFRFLALTPSRVLLVGSSRVIAHPVTLLRDVTPAEVRCTTTGPFLTVRVGDDAHVTSSLNRARVLRMLGRA